MRFDTVPVWFALRGALILVMGLPACTEDKASDGPTITGTDAGDASSVDAADTAGATSSTCSSKHDCDSGVCDFATSTCVACNFPADCATKNARCIKHKCQPQTPCASDKACLAADAVCDKVNGVCVDCLENVDCVGEQLCKVGQCMAKPLPCKSSKQCADKGQVCDGAVCVDCIGDVDCADAAYCDEGICATDYCEPGTSICGAPYTLRTCKSNGSGYADAPCAAGKACANDKCKIVICKPGEKLCQGDTVFTCDGRGVSTGSDFL